MPIRLESRPHQQQCRSNVRLCCQKRQQCRTSFALKFRPFDKVERCFDIVAQYRNIVEATGNKVACCFDIVANVDRALLSRQNVRWARHMLPPVSHDECAYGADRQTNGLDAASLINFTVTKLSA